MWIFYTDCGDPAPGNGSAVTPRGTTYGEIAYIECDNGFTLDGTAQIVCEDGPAWSSLPTCNKIGTCIMGIRVCCKLYVFP